MNQDTQLMGIMPFFIVESVRETISYYTQNLGFSVQFEQTLDGDEEPSFCILGRDQASLMFKHIAPEIQPIPNSTRHSYAPWDAYVSTQNPDALYAEYQKNNVSFHRELETNHDNLRGFEIKDNNGYVLCFARPAER